MRQQEYHYLLVADMLMMPLSVWVFPRLSLISRSLPSARTITRLHQRMNTYVHKQRKLRFAKLLTTHADKAVIIFSVQVALNISIPTALISVKLCNSARIIRVRPTLVSVTFEIVLLIPV